MNNYAMVDENNIVFNIAVWDGETSWTPGCRVFLVREGEWVDVGYLLVEENGDYRFEAPQQEEPQPE